MQISSFQKIEEEEIGNDDLMSSGWVFYGVLWVDDS